MSSNSADDCLVSVIIPTYNRSRTIVRAVNSVLNQGHKNLELLVVDDASTDDTSIVMTTIIDPRVRYIRLPKNGGASAARNEGMRQAKGEYICFQDSDDEWLAGKLELQLAAACAEGAPDDPVCVFHPKIMYIRGGVGDFKATKIICIPSLPNRADRQLLVREIHRNNLISPQTLLMSRGALRAVGLFDHRLVNCEDWDYALSLIYKTNAVYLDEPLVMTYLQSDSISILGRRGARSQLRIALKLLREYQVDRMVLAYHFSRVGWWIGKLGNPKAGRRVLLRAVGLSPTSWKSWARLGAVQGMILRRAITGAN